MGDIGLCLQAVIHGVTHMDKLLHLLEPVRNLRGFGLVQVVRVRPDTVRDIGQEIQEAPTVSASCHSGVRRRIPPADDNRHGKRPKQLHHVQRLVLHHHFVGDTCRHDDGEQGRQRHAHLQYPPVTTNYPKRV